MARDASTDPRDDVAPNFRERVLRVVMAVPPGCVVTYGQVALLAGAPGAARQVGYVLRGVGEERSGGVAAGEVGEAREAAAEVPWHRVVNARGALSTYRLGFGELQRALLEAEGVVFDDDGTLDLERYRWWP